MDFALIIDVIQNSFCIFCIFIYYSVHLYVIFFVDTRVKKWIMRLYMDAKTPGTSWIL